MAEKKKGLFDIFREKASEVVEQAKDQLEQELTQH